MELSSFLILWLLCLSPVIVDGCPAQCECYRSVILGSNHLHVICEKQLERLPLHHLGSDFDNLQVTASRIPVLPDADERATNFTQIRRLFLPSNKITTIQVNSLRAFPLLDLLDLSINNITHIPNELFKTIPNLERLFLSNNPNLSLPENGFSCPELIILIIDRCNLKELPLHFFKNMPKLEQLHLEGNHISYIGLNHIRTFQKMRLVNLEDNNVTVFQLEVVELLAKYDVLIGLSGNPFQCDCNFRVGSELHMLSHMNSSYAFMEKSKQRLECKIPEQKNKIAFEEQDEFLARLECNNSASEVEIDETHPSTSIVNLNVTDHVNSNSN